MIVPLEVFLIQVKNSGIFFFLACVFYFLMCLKSLRIAKLQRMQIVKSFIGLGIGVPLLSIVFWYCHLNSAFEDSVFDSPHVVSIRHYQHILEGKSIADIWSIFFNMVRVWGDFRNISTVLFMLWGLLLGIAFMCCCYTKDFKNVRRRFLFHTIYVLGVFFLYIIAMFLMYIFSMPRAEAVTLACYDRYMLSVDIFILGIIVVFLITQKYGRFYRQFSFVGSLAILIVFFLVNFSVISKNESSSLKHEWIKYRYDFHQFIQNQPIRAQRKYLLYMNRNDSVYVYLLMAYELWSTYGSVSNIPPFSELLYYDYLIIWTPDDISMAYLRDNGLEEYAKFQPMVIPLEFYRATY
jgi:hypothetical protein